VKVVANSGPLMALGKLGLLDLLYDLYGRIYIPSAVYTEVVVRGSEHGYPDAYAARLAIQRGRLVVVLKAREETRVQGLKVRGTLGVIVQAYRTGRLHLDEVEILVQAIISRDDIWIAEELCRRVLAALRTEAR